MKKECKVTVLAFIILFFFFINVFADGGVYWQENGIQICSFRSGFPENVFDGKESAIIIWKDGRNTYDDIYGQRIDIDGNFIWQVDGVPVAITSGPLDPPGGAISDGKGGAIIAWVDGRQWWLTAGDIYAQRLDSLGNRLWGSSGAAVCVADSGQGSIGIVSDGEGGAIIVWEDKRNGFSNSDIYGQRIDSSGVTQWEYNGVPICTLQSVSYLHKLIGVSDGCIVVWADSRNLLSTDWDIFAQKIDENGQMVWNPAGVPICEAESSQVLPFPTPCNDGAIIAWCDKRKGDYDIYAQRVSSDGTIKWDYNGVPICTTSGYQGGYVNGLIAVKDGKEGASIFWDDRRFSNHDIYAQKIDSLGIAHWQMNGVYTGTAGDSSLVDGVILKAIDERGGAIVSWSGYISTLSDVFAQRIDSLGICQWDSNGLIVCSASSAQYMTGICEDGQGGAIISWRDARSDYGKVYAQRVGDITGVEEKDIRHYTTGIKLLSCPNPFISTTTITITFPSKGHRAEGIELNIYDIAGRLVGTIVPEFQSSRVQRVEWNGRDEKGKEVSGVFFIELSSKAYKFKETKKIIKLK